MSRHNADKYLRNHLVAPNVALRLLQRELSGHLGSGAGVHSSRSFSECIIPSHKVLQSEAPNLHIGKFIADGSCLVCFSLQLESLVLLDYLGPTPQPAPGAAAAAAAAGGGGQQQQQPVGFHSFFRERWRLPLCSGSEQLCRDFCLTLHHGRFLLLASCTPQQQAQQGPAEAGTVAGAAAAAQTGATAAAGRAGGAERGQQHQQQQQPQQQRQSAPDTGSVDDGGDVTAQGGLRVPPSRDCCASTTFHVVDVRRCSKVDQRQFLDDHFDLGGNACASLHDNTLALTSIRQQTIHLLHVNRDGTLTDVQQVGRHCQPDDTTPIELAADAEQQWQLQWQHERQQQQYWMHHQARALLPPKHCPQSAPTCQCAPERPVHQQQQQQQQQQAGLGGGGARGASPPVLATAAAAAAGVAGRVRRRPGRGGDGASGGGGSSSSDVSEGDGSDSDSMDAGRGRRVRQRLGTQPPQAAVGAAGAAGAGAGGQARQGAPVQQPPSVHLQQQQQQQQQQPVGLPGARQQQQQQQQWGPQTSPTAGDGGAAAAAAATAAALLDPGGQLITGLRQRLLAFLYSSISSQRPCDVAPSQRDFQHNFGVLSSLVHWRARLLGRHQLLLKFGAPTSGPAAAADANPNRAHFYGVYDLRTTAFTGFWKSSSPQLLATVLEQPCRLLAASGDLSPVERCCAAALYPAGFPVGLEHAPAASAQQQQQQQQAQLPPASAGQQQQQQQHAQLSPALPGRQQQPQQQHDGPAGSAGASPAGVGQADAATSSRQQHGRAWPRPASDSGSSKKAARERLRFLRQVVLMVLPGLQSLSPSPYLDPHLFRYSKHLSPIIGLRNSPAQPIRFQLARRYPGFTPAVHQQQLLLGDAAVGSAALAGAAATAAGPAADGPAAGSGAAQPPQQGHEGHEDVLQLDVVLPPTVVHAGEEVARRQLHLFHPSDPFVLVVVQTPGQPAQLNLYFRM